MKGVQKTEKKIEIIFFIKPFISIICELCQQLKSLRSLRKTPETKTLGGVGVIAPLYKVGLKQFFYIAIKSCMVGKRMLGKCQVYILEFFFSFHLLQPIFKLQYLTVILT